MRIRLQEDGIDRYKVYLPGKNNDFSIGLVWKDPFKTVWKIKPYFSIYRIKSYKVKNETFDDFMRAARMLAKYYNENDSPFFNYDDDFTWPSASD